MRAFSIVASVVALLATANAASVSKRAVSSQVQLCINDLNAASAQLTVVDNAVNAFTAASGYTGAIAVHTQEQKLETLIKQANTDCCAQTTTVSEEDATAVFAVVAQIVPQITTAINDIIAKKSTFAGVLLATPLVKSDISNLNKLLNTLDTCLLNVTPADDLAEAQGYIDTINADFANADAAYGI